MPDILSDQLIQVARDLMLAGIVYIAYKTARDASKSSGRVSALWRGWAWSLGIAAFAALMMGSASCDSGDPMFGYCDQADDGFAPTDVERAARFLYLAILFGVPVTMGAMSVAGHPLRPWAKPERKDP